MVVADSPLLGKNLADTPLANQPKARVLEVIRAGEPLRAPLNEIVLEHGDRLRLTTATGVRHGNQIAGRRGDLYRRRSWAWNWSARKKPSWSNVSSVRIPASSDAASAQMNFRRRYGVLVLAVHRQGVSLREDFADVRLQYGDTLLVEGPESAIKELREGRDFLLLLDVPHTPKRRRKQWLAVGVIALVVALAAFNVMPIARARHHGRGAVSSSPAAWTRRKPTKRWSGKSSSSFSGCWRSGWRWRKPRARNSSLTASSADSARSARWLVLAAIVVIASVMTAFLSNNAVAVLLTPIVIQTAAALHVSARPFIIAVAIGASACFATPIGYQTNTLVYGAGGYRFSDYLKVGLPLNLAVLRAGGVFHPEVLAILNQRRPLV